MATITFRCTDSKLYEADGDRGYYYSAEGFDVEANVGVPGADWLSGVVGYYWWEGQHGDNDEEGTKFGFRARPNTSWEFEFEYDHANEGDQEIGGRLSYTRQIGDQPSFNVSSRPFGGNFNPRNHFYDIVRREYAQRIRFAREQGGFVFHFGSVDFDPKGQGAFGGDLNFMPSGTFGGIALNAANYSASVLASVIVPRAEAVTVVMSGGSAGQEVAIPVGRNATEAVATIRFIVGASDSSEYILGADQGGRAVSVITGALWWDDPISGGAHIPTAGAGGSDHVMLEGTGFSITAGASEVIGSFVLYEGKATPVIAGDVDTEVLNCNQSSNEGRDRADNFTTECYGDLATFANGANLALGGTPLEDNSDYPNSTEAQLIASGQAMLTMRGGRSNTENVEISFTGETTVDILNNVAGGVRYVKVKDGSFKIGAQDVSCDPGDKNENTILAYVGAVAAYCPDALSTFLLGDGGVPPVGIANNGFSSGVILTVTVPFNGVDMSFSLVGTVPAGISLDPENGVLSASAVTGLGDGVNEIQVLQEITAIPGVDLPESQNLVVEVHKLPSAFTQNVVIDEADAVLAFVDVDSERKIAMIGGLELENAVFSNVQAGDLAGKGVSYSAAGVFSLDSGALAEGDIGVLGSLTVDVTADNIRGTHQLVVEVEAVNILQIESQYQVPGNAVEAAILGGTTGRVTDLTPGVSDTSKVVLTYDTTTEGAKVTPAGQVELTDSLEAGEASKVVTVEIVHTPTPAYSASGRPFPNPKQTDYPTLVLNVEVTVWRLDAPGVQSETTSSRQPSEPNDPTNVAAMFAAPGNPVGSGINFATGGSWMQIGTPEEGLTIDDAGNVLGTPVDRPPLGVDDYTIELTATFKHPNLGSDLDLQMALLVVDSSEPSTILLTTPTGNGQVVAYVNGVALTPDANGLVSAPNKAQVQIAAIPNPGYHVSLWADGDGTAVAALLGANAMPAEFESSGCASAPVGHGGRKICALTAGNGKEYEIQASFAVGAVAADLAAIAGDKLTDDTPFDHSDDDTLVDLLTHVCLAFGGTRTSTDDCTGYNEDGATANCSIIDFSSKNVRSGTCYGSNTYAFRVALRCNLENKKAKSVSTCGDTCSSGMVAVGGQCITPFSSVVNYAQPTGGSLEVARLYGGGGAIASGDTVPGGVLLNLSADPDASNYVAAWEGCEGGALGSLGEPDVAKSCMTSATVAVLSVGVSLAAVPSGFDYPLPLTGEFVATETHCTALGGAVDNPGGGTLFRCKGFTTNPNAVCNLAGPQGNTCSNAFSVTRMCNLSGFQARTANACETSSTCAANEYPVGSACKSGTVNFAQVASFFASENKSVRRAARDLAARRAAAAEGARLQGDDFFFRAALNDAAGEIPVSRASWGGGAALPDVLSPNLNTVSSGLLEDTVENCLALGGRTASAPVEVSGAIPPVYCVGLAEFSFCVVKDKTGAFACAGTLDEGGLYERVRLCNDAGDADNPGNQLVADNFTCGDVCPEGLTARGNQCVVADSSGNTLTETLDVGFISPSLTYQDPPNQTLLEDTVENCLALGGSTASAPVEVSGAIPPVYCVGLAEFSFCVVKDKTGAFACAGTLDEGGLYNRVLLCNGAANDGEGTSGNQLVSDNFTCGKQCLNGLAARGNQCVPPPMATDGLFIIDPDEERGALTSSTLTVGLNQVPAGPITVRAVPNAGYHVAEWLGSCGGGVAEASPFSPAEQTCVVTKVTNTALSVGVRFEYGLLDHSIPVTATVIANPTGEMCAGLGGTLRMTLGAGSGSTEYCDGFNQRNPAASGESQRDAEDENIEDQCWISGGFIGTVDTDDSLDGNIQRCHSAFVVARECNKLNMRSVSILPKPAPSEEECDSGSGPVICAPQAFARGVGNPPAASGLCGEACGDGMIAQGGNCIAADQAKTRFADPN